MDVGRSLPVLVLADTSGNMRGSRIAAINAALDQFPDDLARVAVPPWEVHLGVITFATRVEVGAGMPVSRARVQEHSAGGRTALGAAIDAARDLLHDADRLPARACAPTLVLVSDGAATDHIGRAVRALLASDLGGRATRMALAVGNDADTEVLRGFIADSQTPLVRTSELATIGRFFRWVARSVEARINSPDPDVALVAPPSAAGISDDDLVF